MNLIDTARICLSSVLDVKDNEEVLIITNPDEELKEIANAIFSSVIDFHAFPTLIVQPVKTQLDFAEPSVIYAIKGMPDIVISISKEKLGKDLFALKKPYFIGKKKYDHIFNYLLKKKKIRGFWSPGITKEIFLRTVPINYEKMRINCRKLKKELDKADGIRVISERGTDVYIGLKKRKAMVDDGDFRKRGKGGNLPCGEVYISPEIGNSYGTIVFDGSLSGEKGVIIVKEPVKVKVRDGKVEKILGGEEAKALRNAIEYGVRAAEKLMKEGKLKNGKEYMENANALGEFGIGLNENARIVGNVLEDEKVYSTCHIAIGSNFDDDLHALIHLDGLIMKPTVITYSSRKEKKIMEKGKIISQTT
ncbi:MAG: leucyl aminopeptidase [Candidatus Thermoplasmatota archaeon]